MCHRNEWHNSHRYKKPTDSQARRQRDRGKVHRGSDAFRSAAVRNERASGASDPEQRKTQRDGRAKAKVPVRRTSEPRQQGQGVKSRGGLATDRACSAKGAASTQNWKRGFGRTSPWQAQGTRCAEGMGRREDSYAPPDARRNAGRPRGPAAPRRAECNTGTIPPHGGERECPGSKPPTEATPEPGRVTQGWPRGQPGGPSRHRLESASCSSNSRGRPLLKAKPPSSSKAIGSAPPRPCTRRGRHPRKAEEPASSHSASGTNRKPA